MMLGRGRTEEFHLGVVSHQQLLARGQHMGVASLHHANAMGSYSEEAEEWHKDQVSAAAQRSTRANSTKAISTSSFKTKKKIKPPPEKIGWS